MLKCSGNLTIIISNNKQKKFAMAKAKKIAVTKQTFANLIERKLALQTLVKSENGEKAEENYLRNETIGNQLVEFRQNVEINQKSLDELNELIDRVVVIDPEEQNAVVRIGSVVTLKFPAIEITMKFDGVSVSKYDKIISAESPIGLKIAGKSAGDEVIINDIKVIIEQIFLPSQTITLIM